MRGRVVRRVVAATVVGILAASASARAADPRLAAPGLVVDVRMTVAQDVPPSVVAGLKAEAETIWRTAGVTLRWNVSPDDAEADASLRVLVMARGGSAVASRHTWPVGELLIDQAGRHFAVVSTGAARRVVAAVRAPHEPQALADRRLALVLGRAVAHELGHYLLATAGHTPSGLMRAYVAVADYVDPRRGGFRIDAAAGDRIRAAWPRAGATPSPVAGSARPPR
jgi:hypothetical protein